MRAVTVILLVLAAQCLYAGSWIEADTLGAYTVNANSITWGSGLWVDSCPSDVWIIGNRPHDTAREYVTGVDTSLVLKRIECDTTWTQVSEDSLGRPEFSIRRDCDTVYRYQIDTLWADKVTVRLTPTELSKLMDLIREGE